MHFGTFATTLENAVRGQSTNAQFIEQWTRSKSHEPVSVANPLFYSVGVAMNGVRATVEFSPHETYLLFRGDATALRSAFSDALARQAELNGEAGIVQQLVDAVPVAGPAVVAHSIRYADFATAYTIIKATVFSAPQ